MSRWLTAGAESQQVVSEEFLSVGAGAVNFNSSVQRAGGSTACFICAASAANYLSSFILGSIGTTWYAKMPFRIGGALPSTALTIARAMDTGTTQKIAAKVTTAGVLQIVDTNGTVLDSYSSISFNHWYVLLLGWADNSSGNSSWGWQLWDDVSHLILASGLGTAAVTNNPTADFRMGHQTAGDTASTVQLDDIAINASGGTEDLTFPDWRGVIVHGLPISDNSVGTGWLTSAGGSTSLFNDVDNVPPTGVAATPTTGQTQIKNANATAGQLNYVANVQSYTTMGVPSGATINRVRSAFRCAGSSTTGTNDALIRLLSNPDDGATTTASGAFDTVAANDTGSGSDGWATFTTPWNILPSVTRGTQPTVRIGKNSASTRVAMCDSMFVQVEFVPTSVDGTAATLKWDLNAAVNSTAETLKWDLNAAVNSSAESLLWDLTALVNSSAESLLWDLQSAVAATAESLKWDLFGFVGQTCTLDWDMGELVNGNTSMLKWDLFGEVDEDQTFVWDMIAQINSDAETFKWDLYKLIDASAETLIWDYPGVANADPVSLIWDLGAALGLALTLIWGLPIEGPSEDLTMLWRLWGPQGRLRWMDSDIDLESTIKLER